MKYTKEVMIMSLKGKITTFSTYKIASSVLNTNLVDNTVNNVLTKLGKAAGQKTSYEHIQQSKKHCLVIKTKSYSLGSIVGLFTEESPELTDYLCRYQIFDVSGNIKYKSEAENTIVDREIIDLYDAVGNKIGYIKEHFFAVGVPLFEKDVKKCSVYLGTQKIAELKKYVSFGDLEFETLEGDVKITHDEGKTFKIKYKNKLIATLLNVPLNLKDGYVDKFVMEYEDTSTEVEAVLLATAVDLINKT